MNKLNSTTKTKLKNEYPNVYKVLVKKRKTPQDQGYLDFILPIVMKEMNK